MEEQRDGEMRVQRTLRWRGESRESDFLFPVLPIWAREGERESELWHDFLNVALRQGVYLRGFFWVSMPPILIQTCFSHLFVSLLMDVVQRRRRLGARSGPLLHRTRCSDPITIHTPAVLLLRASEERGGFLHDAIELLNLSCRGHTLPRVLLPSHAGDFWSFSHTITVSCYWRRASHRVHGFSFSYEMKGKEQGDRAIFLGAASACLPQPPWISTPSPEKACCFSRRARKKKKKAKTRPTREIEHDTNISAAPEAHFSRSPSREAEVGITPMALLAFSDGYEVHACSVQLTDCTRTAEYSLNATEYGN